MEMHTFTEPVFGTTLVGYTTRSGVLMGMDSLSSFAVSKGEELVRTGVQSYHYNKMFPLGHGIMVSMSGNLVVAEKLMKKMNAEYRKHLSFRSRIPLTIEKIGIILTDYIVRIPDWDGARNWVNFLIAGFEKNEPCLLEVNGYGQTKHVFTSVGGEGLADETLSEGYDYEMDVAV
ncbi:hypothetical protein MKW92_047841, partial [Papaver armeniacum]